MIIYVSLGQNLDFLHVLLTNISFMSSVIMFMRMLAKLFPFIAFLSGCLTREFESNFTQSCTQVQNHVQNHGIARTYIVS